MQERDHDAISYKYQLEDQREDKELDCGSGLNCYDVGFNGKYQFEEEMVWRGQKEGERNGYEQFEDQKKENGELLQIQELNEQQSEKVVPKLKVPIKKYQKLRDFTIQRRFKHSAESNKKIAKDSPKPPICRRIKNAHKGESQAQQECKYPRLFILRNIYPRNKGATQGPDAKHIKKVEPNILKADQIERCRLKEKIENGLIDFTDEKLMEKQLEVEMEKIMEEINQDIQKVVELDQSIRYLKTQIPIDLASKHHRKPKNNI